ncbi:MAG TPA: hypothetical protein VHJ20_09665 [Polyangia bacterium]|nr:hypothetical protein [Polyangia bacterium]
MPTNADPAQGAAPQSFGRRHRGKLILFAFVVVVAGGATLWTMATLAFSYSSGDRVGYVQKLSRKGWVCRTWEGELAMTPVPGSAPEIFYFTVPNPAVARSIQEAEGKKVALHYEEKRGVPNSCFGDTHYFITEVRALGQ